MPTSDTPTKGSIAKMKAFVRRLARSDIGYNQWNRWAFYQNGRLVKGRTSADCSSMCGAIGQQGGYGVNLSGTFYTGNFADRLRQAGFEVFRFINVSQMRDGDFVVAPGKHVEFQYGRRDGKSGVWWYSARNDENGRLGGGRPGNQGGRENVGWGRPYDMSRGGSRVAYIVRPPDSKAEMTVLPKGPKGTLRKGDGKKRKNSIGTRVRTLQLRLRKFGYNTEPDGDYGDDTERDVRDFQRQRGFAKRDQDGQWGPVTAAESIKAREEKWRKK